MTILSLFSQVTSGNHYDIEKAIAHHAEMTNAKVKAKDLPDIEEAFIKQNNAGCCLHYSMFLFKLLREAGYESYLSMTLEENPVTGEKTDWHMSVCYMKDGEMLFADPVETVKGSTEKQYDISLEEFQKIQGTIWVYDPYGENGEMEFYKDFMFNPLKVFSAN